MAPKLSRRRPADERMPESATMNKDQMLLRGAVVALIGIAVLLGPHVMRSDGWRELLDGAQLVGWFALVLGAAMIGVDLLRRGRRK